MRVDLPVAGRYRYVVFPDAQELGGGGDGRLFNYGRHRHAVASSRLGAGSSDEPLGADERAFLGWLFARAELDVARYKTETLRRRLAACLRALRVASVNDARRVLEDGPPRLRRAALTTILIGVTHFYRDPHVFGYLAEHVLPRLATRGPRLRVWSVGCSDGPELYTVAMLLDHMGLLGRCDLLGTDCRPDAVERARDGLYDDAAVRTVPADVRARHLTREGRHWRVSRRLRDATQWRTADVLALREPGLWDLVLCRNLAIYLQPQAASNLWRQLEAAVRPGGVLALGKAERPGCTQRFAPVGPCLYRHTSSADVT